MNDRPFFARALSVALWLAGPAILLALLGKPARSADYTAPVGVSGVILADTDATHDPPPTLAGISPTEAYNYQATWIAITGTHFTAVPTVTLGATALMDVIFISDTTLSATVPAELPEGSYMLVVTNPDGQSASLANAFQVLRSGDGSLGPWQIVSSMPAARSEHAAVIAGDFLYVLGGYEDNSVIRAAIKADGSLGSWQNMTPLGARRYDGVAAVAANGHIYVIGELTDDAELPTVERAQINPDGSLGSWQATTPMAEARITAAAVQSGGYIYVLGGQGGYDSVERAAINADGSLEPWQLMAPMHVHRQLPGAVVANGHLYAIGGNGLSVLANETTVEMAAILPDGTLGPWEWSASLAVPRNHSSSVLARGFVYALGGQNIDGGGTWLSSVERAAIHADGSLGPWQTTTSMTIPRQSFASVAAKGYIFAIGGMSEGAPVSSVERAQFLLDLTAPNATALSINGGALSSASANVSVSLSASDSGSGVADMSFSNDATEWSEWQSYSTLASWTLEPGDGMKTVYGRARDAAGQVSSVVSSTIDLDTTVPMDYGFSIDDGALFTNKVTVTLSIGAQPETAQMQVSNDGGFSGASWEPYTSHKIWQITQYGNYVIPRVVYVRYKDVAGNLSATFQDDIILDVTAPTGTIDVVPSLLANGFQGTENVEGNAGRETDVRASDSVTHTVFLPIVLRDFPWCPPSGPTNVTLFLSAEDDVSGVADMMISNDEGFPCASWQPYATIKGWYAPEGITTVYARFRDHAGNVSEVATDTVTIP